MRARSLLACLLPLAAQTPHLLEVRLETPLATFSARPGDPIQAVTTHPLRDGSSGYLPAGSRVYGSVAEVRSVGMGLIRERASLLLRFDEIELPSSVRVPLHARLAGIDNARESVTRTGLIRGVLAAQNPQNFTQGLWRRPNIRLFSRSALGVTGLSGKLASRFSFAPGLSAGLMAARGVLTHMPEPEISLPQGIDLKLRLQQFPETQEGPPPDCCIVPQAVRDRIEDLHPFLDKPKGKPVVDLLNIAFLGSRADLDAAFSSAGWLPAEPLTRATFAKAYKAYTTMSGYGSAPVSLLQWRGRAPSVVYQKSFNTLSQRHHVRVYPAGDVDGRKLWLGAATHDVGIGFDPASLSFTHRVDFRIDREREKVATDLLFPSCAEQLGYVPRPRLANLSAPAAITDGRILVLSLQPCSQSFHHPSTQRLQAPGGRLRRAARRILLETRNYLLRGNAYYFAIAFFRDHLLPSRRKPLHPDN
jgi:hypothetical protein